MITIEELNKYGSDVFGSREKYELWLDSYILALGAKPKDLLESETGRSKVKDVLIRIEHGIFG